MSRPRFACWLRGHSPSLALRVRGHIVYPHDIPNEPIAWAYCERCGAAYNAAPSPRSGRVR